MDFKTTTDAPERLRRMRRWLEEDGRENYDDGLEDAAREIEELRRKVFGLESEWRAAEREIDEADRRLNEIAMILGVPIGELLPGQAKTSASELRTAVERAYAVAKHRESRVACVADECRHALLAALGFIAGMSTLSRGGIEAVIRNALETPGMPPTRPLYLGQDMIGCDDDDISDIERADRAAESGTPPGPPSPPRPRCGRCGCRYDDHEGRGGECLDCETCPAYLFPEVA